MIWLLIIFKKVLVCGIIILILGYFLKKWYFNILINVIVVFMKNFNNGIGKLILMFLGKIVGLFGCKVIIVWWVFSFW